MEIGLLRSAIESMRGELRNVSEKQEQIKSKQIKQDNVELTSPAQDQNLLLDRPTGTLPQDNAVGLLNHESLQHEIVRLGQHIEELYIKFEMILAAIDKLESSIDNLEQYGRRNCIILHGLKSANFPSPHDYNEFLEVIIQIINNNIGLKITSQDVDIAHPLQAAKDGRIPIIIKFIRRSDRNAVYSKKRLLLGSGLAITESLTKRRLSLLKEAADLLGKENVWSFYGSIYTNLNSKKQLIKNQEELYRIVSEF